MSSSSHFLLLLLASLTLMANANNSCMASDTTTAFTTVQLVEKNFHKQWPYDLPLQDRYCNADGVRKLWVYSTDKPFQPQSATKPRTEIRIRGYDYASGVWQFEGYGFVPNGTTGTSIMQIHGMDDVVTVLMLRVYDGQLNYYKRTVLETDIYDKWIKYNVIHDANLNLISVFMDGVKKLEVAGKGSSMFYFKFGVYTQNNASYYMESRWKDIRVMYKSL